MLKWFKLFVSCSVRLTSVGRESWFWVIACVEEFTRLENGEASDLHLVCHKVHARFVRTINHFGTIDPRPSVWPRNTVCGFSNCVIATVLCVCVCVYSCACLCVYMLMCTNIPCMLIELLDQMCQSLMGPQFLPLFADCHEFGCFIV